MEKKQVVNPVDAKIDISFPPTKVALSDDGKFVILKFEPVAKDRKMTPEIKQLLAEIGATSGNQRLMVFDHRPSVVASLGNLKPRNFGDLIKAKRHEEFLSCLRQLAKVGITRKIIDGGSRSYDFANFYPPSWPIPETVFFIHNSEWLSLEVGHNIDFDLNRALWGWRSPLNELVAGLTKRGHPAYVFRKEDGTILSTIEEPKAWQ